MTSTLNPVQDSRNPGLYERRIKRLFDVVLAVPVAILLAPLAAIVAIFIKSEDNGPILFKQERVGRNGDLFILRKFRSMPVDTENVESGKAHALKVTRVGSILRRTSLDEIPQLASVFIGDMSVVGPRPPIPAQVDLVELRRANGSIELKPGLTGLAQVNSYDGMTPESKAEWDRTYLKSISPLSDAKIIVLTVGYLLKKPPQY